MTHRAQHRHAIALLFVVAAVGAPPSPALGGPWDGVPPCLGDTSVLPRVPSDVHQDVVEAHAGMVAIHGRACAEAGFHAYGAVGSQRVLRMENVAVDLASHNVSRATVLLNGWWAGYEYDDQFSENGVAVLAVDVTNVRMENQILKWDVLVAFSDRDFNDPFKVCHQFTVLGWDSTQIDAEVFEPQNSKLCFGGSGWSDANTLSVSRSSVRHPSLAGKAGAAVLPRAFGFVSTKTDGVLQIAYDLDHSERLSWETTSLVSPVAALDRGSVAWESKAVVKDNDTRGSYYWGERAAVIGGNDVDVFQPPFDILPLEEGNCKDLASTDEVETEFVVYDVPFKFAVPVLTGWNLAFRCGQRPVERMGAWISKFRFNDPSDPPNTLRYTLVRSLVDSGWHAWDSVPQAYWDRRVNVLGFGAAPGVADLVPASPDSTTQFCNRTQPEQLIVQVRNIGTGFSPTSRTRVELDVLGQKVTTDLVTPPVPGGGLVTIGPVVMPGRCFANRRCTFTIRADQYDDVKESAAGEQNNEVQGECPR